MWVVAIAGRGNRRQWGKGMNNFNQEETENIPAPIVEEAAPRRYIIAGVVATLGIILVCVVGVVLLTSGTLFVQAGPTAAPVERPSVIIIGNVEANAPLAIRGTGFAPNEQVDIYIATAPNASFDTFTQIGSTTAGADGAINLTGLMLPPSDGRTLYIIARGSTSGFAPPTTITFSDVTPPADTATAPPAETPTTPATLPPTPGQPTPTSPPPTPTSPPPPNDTRTPVPTATQTPTPDPGAIGIWVGRYFDNRDLIPPPVFTRYDRTLKFDWRSGSPGPGIPNDNFSVLWTRNEEFGASNNYQFTLSVDDAARVYVDGVLIIDEWRIGGLRTVTANRFISRGVHQIRVEYYEANGNASISLEWQVSYAGWIGRYYNTPNLSGPVVLIRDDADINFDWGFNSPSPEVNPDNFSIDWTRRVNFPLSANYVFTAEVDDGVRIFVNGATVLDNFGSSGSRTITGAIALSAGQHDIQVQYVERTGQAKIRVTWAPVIQPPTPTPTATTSPTPTDTPPPTDTSEPPTVTPTLPPATDTPEPPTAVPEPPTATTEPPTATTEPPTDTVEPPTETPTETPAADAEPSPRAP